MESQDRQAIEGLFDRLNQAERGGPSRDAEAEALIRDRIAGQPGAPYLMAQTIVMQDYALAQAQQRIEGLEREAAERPAAGGGFLSGLFGGSRPERADAPSAQTGAPERPGGSPMGAPIGMGASGPSGAAGSQPPLGQPGRGGGFLAGAAQTAMGVAGGVLLANAVGSMFGGDEAKAAEAKPAEAQPAAEPQPTETAAAEPAADEGGGGLGSFFGGDDDGEVV